MPSTIVHLGVQGSATRLFWGKAPLLWIYAGAMLPDLPWILQRGLRLAPMEIDPFSLMSYSLVMSSLPITLLLCLALALFCRTPARIFALLAVSSLLHLLLDALEYKAGNGVLLLAPFSWHFSGWGVLPGDGPVAFALAAAALAYVMIMSPATVREDLGLLRRPPRARWMAALGLAGLYAVLPALWITRPVQHDLMYMGTLRDRDPRTGRAIALDRARYDPEREGGSVRIFSGEVLRVRGFSHPRAVHVSIEGVFEQPDTIRVHRYRTHTPWVRDLGSYLGLGLLAVLGLGHAVYVLRRGPPVSYG